jgi:hypothetical protein
MLPVVRAMAKLGATDMEIAQALKVSIGAVELWCRTHKEFLRAIKPAKGVADDRAERSLFRSATGYSYDSEELFLVDVVTEKKVPGEKPEDRPTIVTTRTKEVIRAPVVKHQPPHPTSLIFWLKNRRKDRWRDFKATELSTPPGKPFEVIHGGPGEPELIGQYYERLRRSGKPSAPGGALGADPGADPGVDPGGQEPQGQGGSPTPGKG